MRKKLNLIARDILYQYQIDLARMESAYFDLVGSRSFDTIMEFYRIPQVQALEALIMVWWNVAYNHSHGNV